MNIGETSKQLHSPIKP